MENMLAMLGAIAPDELLIKQLKDGLEKYEETGELDTLGMPCMLILSKLAAGAAGGPMEFMKDLEKADAGKKLLDPGES